MHVAKEGWEIDGAGHQSLMVMVDNVSNYSVADNDATNHSRLPVRPVTLRSADVTVEESWR